MRDVAQFPTPTIATRTDPMAVFLPYACYGVSAAGVAAGALLVVGLLSLMLVGPLSGPRSALIRSVSHRTSRSTDSIA